MEKKLWYAIEKDMNDADWGMGSFDFYEAVNMANKEECKFIAEIDGDFDENGNATTDPICTAVYEKNKDF